LSQTQRLKRQLEKLHIAPGDIVVCHDAAAMEQLAGAQIAGINFPVPIILCEGAIETLSREQLLRLVAAASGRAPVEHPERLSLEGNYVERDP
jgi:hypothetical protein